MAQMPLELILFRQLAQSLAVPVVLVDDAGGLVYLNEAAEGLLGLRLEEIDQPSYETWTAGLRPRTPDGAAAGRDDRPLARTIAERRPAHGTLLITDREGSERTIEITAFPLEGGRGRMLGAVAMFWEPRSP